MKDGASEGYAPFERYRSMCRVRHGSQQYRRLDVVVVRERDHGSQPKSILDLILLSRVRQLGCQRRSPIRPRKIYRDPRPSALLFQSLMQHRTLPGQLRNELKAFFGAVRVTVK